MFIQTWRIHWKCKVSIGVFIKNAESDMAYAVYIENADSDLAYSLKTLSQAWRMNLKCWIRLGKFIENAESDLAYSLKTLSQAWRIYWKSRVRLGVLTEKAESDLAHLLKMLSLTWRNHWRLEVCCKFVCPKCIWMTPPNTEIRRVYDQYLSNISEKSKKKFV